MEEGSFESRTCVDGMIGTPLHVPIAVLVIRKQFSHSVLVIEMRG